MLDRDFYSRPTLTVARDLIGCLLVFEVDGAERVGMIVETEAYDGFDDAASHAHRGQTRRNAAMFGPPGHAYVYLIYGIYHCLNLVTRQEGYPAAVLIRALEPLGELPACNGPGRLTRTMGLDLRQNGLDVTAPPLYLLPRQQPMAHIARTPRIGVDYAGSWAAKPWRFADPRSASLSVRL